jgi:hypothetical protein
LLEKGAEENIWTYELNDRRWEKLHQEEFHNLFISPDIAKHGEIKDDGIGGKCSTNRRSEMCAKLWLESFKGRDHL